MEEKTTQPSVQTQQPSAAPVHRPSESVVRQNVRRKKPPHSSNNNKKHPANKAGKKKKKRRLKLKKLLFVSISTLVVAGLIITACVQLVQSVWKHFDPAVKEAQQLAQQQAEEQAKQEAFLEALPETISAVTQPEDLDDEVFETLKEEALQAVSEEDASYQIFTNLDAYSADILAFYVKDEDRAEFVLQYPNRQNYRSAADVLDESLDSVPHLLQWDLRWGYVPYGDSTIWEAGCAPTSLAMVLSYLLQDGSITPALIADYSYNHGYYVSGAGTSHALMYDISNLYPEVEAYQVLADAATVTSLLEQGYLLIFAVNPGDFTTTGHFIVVDGLVDGQLSVKDPNSNKNTDVLWDIDQVLNQTSAVFSYKLKES